MKIIKKLFIVIIATYLLVSVAFGTLAGVWAYGTEEGSKHSLLECVAVGSFKSVSQGYVPRVVWFLLKDLIGQI